MQDNDYEKRLKICLSNLKSCQESLGLKDCFDCEKFFDCEIRKKYVDSVYYSMSKGQTGGFDF